MSLDSEPVSDGHGVISRAMWTVIILGIFSFAAKASLLCRDRIAMRKPFGVRAGRLARRFRLRLIDHQYGEVDSATEADLVVDFYGPKNTFQFPSRSFDSVFKDAMVSSRLDFLRNRALSRDESGDSPGFRAVVDDYETETSTEPWDQGIRDGISKGTVRLNVIYQEHPSGVGKFLESPEIALVGIISQLFFTELSELYAESWTDLIDTGVASATLAGLCTGNDCRTQVSDVFRLRTTWYNKLQFYTEMVKHRQDFPRDFFLEDLLEIDQSDLDLDLKIKSSFKRFHYGIDPRFIDLLWDVPLPERWEFAMANPPRLASRAR